MGKTAAVIGTYDTKEKELQLLTQRLNQAGVHTIAVDTGLGGHKGREADFMTSQLLKEEGYLDRIPKTSEEKADYLDKTARKAAEVVCRLQQEGKIHGAISIGGGQGSFIAGTVMRALPIGFPKLLLSTIALVESSAGQFKHLNDTLVMNSLVDIAGMNSILDGVITKAAGAMAGMLDLDTTSRKESDRPAIGISAWGVTTPCVNMVCEALEQNGFEVYIFHSNGDGGVILEKLIRQGVLCAVADLTLPEITMPLAGACVDEIPDRLENAARAGIPQIISPGGVDMILAASRDVQKGGRFEGRRVYQHNPQVLFVRSNKDENIRFGEVIAEKVNASQGPVKICIPTGGFSAVDREGEIFYDVQADKAFVGALKAGITNEQIEIMEIPGNINDSIFAEAVVSKLGEMLSVG